MPLRLRRCGNDDDVAAFTFAMAIRLDFHSLRRSQPAARFQHLLCTPVNLCGTQSMLTGFTDGDTHIVEDRQQALNQLIDLVQRYSLILG